ncbi:MAG TPA: hypothetical protein VHE35_15830 [Kofleriaceae bacterium]|nr:hypothetical protein [Kofleriaceae bacterium]
MPRHHAPANSPANPSLRYLAASDFDLVVGGAGRPDVLHADHYLPGGGADQVSIKTAPPISTHAADGPGFTWGNAAAPDPTAVHGDVPGGGHLTEGSWEGTLGGAWDHAGTPAASDGLHDVQMFDAHARPADSAMTDDVGQVDLHDIMPYEATQLPTDAGPVDVQDTGDGGHCHGGDGQGHHDGGGGGHHCGDGGGDGGGAGGGAGDAGLHHCHDGGGAGDGTGHGDGSGAGDGHVEVATTAGSYGYNGDPLSWSHSVTDHPTATTATPATPVDVHGRPDAAPDVNTMHPGEVSSQPQGSTEVAGLLDWAFSANGPIAGAVGAATAHDLWGYLEQQGGNLLHR